MQIRYAGLQNVTLDREADDHQVICGAWRDEGVLQDVQNVMGTHSCKKASQEAESVLEALLQQHWSTTMAERYDLISFVNIHIGLFIDYQYICILLG